LRVEAVDDPLADGLAQPIDEVGILYPAGGSGFPVFGSLCLQRFAVVAHDARTLTT
jgi:hypothetical protein